jgi:hypothetical protein
MWIAATGFGVTLVAASRHKREVYQLLFMQRLLKVSKQCFKHLKSKGKGRPIPVTKCLDGRSRCPHSRPRRGGKSARRLRRFTPGKDPVPHVQEAGWAPGPVWTCAKDLAPTGIFFYYSQRDIRSPDRPARSQSLYRLSYPAHLQTCRGC